jgi:hypothetical protein
VRVLVLEPEDVGATHETAIDRSLNAVFRTITSGLVTEAALMLL